jgi:hypothetical protein
MPVEPRVLSWLKRHGLDRGLYAGSVPLVMEGCPDPESVVGSVLVLEGAAASASRAQVEVVTVGQNPPW